MRWWRADEGVCGGRTPFLPFSPYLLHIPILSRWLTTCTVGRPFAKVYRPLFECRRINASLEVRSPVLVLRVIFFEQLCSVARTRLPAVHYTVDIFEFFPKKKKNVRSILEKRFVSKYPRYFGPIRIIRIVIRRTMEIVLTDLL